MTRAPQPRLDVTVLVRQLALAGESAGTGDPLDPELVTAIVEEAARFACVNWSRSTLLTTRRSPQS